MTKTMSMVIIYFYAQYKKYISSFSSALYITLTARSLTTLKYMYLFIKNRYNKAIDLDGLKN